MVELRGKILACVEVQQIGRVAVHPTNSEIVFVAALGHPYGANDERGVYRTTNGGQSWEKVFFSDQNTGAMQIEFDPQDANTLIVIWWSIVKPSRPKVLRKPMY